MDYNKPLDPDPKKPIRSIHAENVSQAINSTKDDAKLKVNLEKKIEMMEKFNESLADHEREDTSWVVGFFRDVWRDVSWEKSGKVVAICCFCCVFFVSVRWYVKKIWGQDDKMIEAGGI